VASQLGVKKHAAFQPLPSCQLALSIVNKTVSAPPATWYRKSAEQGIAVAQFNYALRCLHGDGVDEDEHEAVRWLIKAAQQGHVEATGQLGTLCRFGQGIERNIVTAAQLHVKAATAGDVVSIGNLASYYKEIEHEALSGSLRAALALAKIFNSGLGVEPNPVVGFAWILWGRRYGHRDDDENARRDEYELSWKCHSNLSEVQRDEAYRLVEQMRPRLEQP
jgi:TPR repeat protein